MGAVARSLVAALAIGLCAPGLAWSTTLDDAIALALKHDAGLRQAQAEHDAAGARVREAEAGRMPTVALEGSAAESSTDFDHFFGFGRYALTPRTADVAVRLPLYSGGAINASVAQARAGQQAAGSMTERARLGLIADVAQAYLGVRTAEQSLELSQSQVEELALLVAQTQRKFDDGEAPVSDVDQAQARLSAAKAGLAGAQGDLARVRARYVALVGEEPSALAPVTDVPATPANLDDAVAAAESGNPNIAAAEANVRAADAAIGGAKAARLPTVNLVAEASTIRDEFLPGYRADAVSIGVEGRWMLFAGGATSAKIGEAADKLRAAEAGLDQARTAVDEGVTDAWQTRRTADALADAASDQRKAADAALESIRNEVRVGSRPTLDLLDAERDALAARIGELRARADRIVAAYRLKAVMGG